MTAGSLTILTYHAIDHRGDVIAISPELFQRQMQTLAELGFRGISLEQAMIFRHEYGKYPERVVVLTFDDGYASVYDAAFPVLRGLNFTATLYVVSQLIGKNANLSAMVNPDLDRDMMNWEKLQELRAYGMEVGSHTATHPRLPRLQSAQLVAELVQSRECLGEQLKQTIKSFAYPYGVYTRGEVELVARYYQNACTTYLGRNNLTTDPYLLRRIDAYYVKSQNMFRRLCHGQLNRYFIFRQLARTLKGRLIHNLAR